MIERGLNLMELHVDGLTNKPWMNRAEAYKAVHDLIRLINMTPVGAFKYEDTRVGPSFCQIIMESHIFVDYINKAVCTVVFSCKDFDTELAANYITEKFEIYKFLNDTPKVFERGFGMELPHSSHKEEVKV